MLGFAGHASLHPPAPNLASPPPGGILTACLTVSPCHCQSHEVLISTPAPYPEGLALGSGTAVEGASSEGTRSMLEEASPSPLTTVAADDRWVRREQEQVGLRVRQAWAVGKLMQHVSLCGRQACAVGWSGRWTCAAGWLAQWAGSCSTRACAAGRLVQLAGVGAGGFALQAGLRGGQAHAARELVRQAGSCSGRARAARELVRQAGLCSGRARAACELVRQASLRSWRARAAHELVRQAGLSSGLVQLVSVQSKPAGTQRVDQGYQRKSALGRRRQA